MEDEAEFREKGSKLLNLLIKNNILYREKDGKFYLTDDFIETLFNLVQRNLGRKRFGINFDLETCAAITVARFMGAGGGFTEDEFSDSFGIPLYYLEETKRKHPELSSKVEKDEMRIICSKCGCPYRIPDHTKLAKVTPASITWRSACPSCNLKHTITMK